MRLNLLPPETISRLYCERLQQEGLEKEDTYVKFTNRYWDRLQEIKRSFLEAHQLSPADLDLVGPLQKGILLYLEAGAKNE